MLANPTSPERASGKGIKSKHKNENDGMIRLLTNCTMMSGVARIPSGIPNAIKRFI